MPGSGLARNDSRTDSTESGRIVLVADDFSGQSANGAADFLVQLTRLVHLDPSVYGPSGYTASTLVDNWSGYGFSSSSLDILDHGS
jgi:hypothetical protein